MFSFWPDKEPENIKSITFCDVDVFELNNVFHDSKFVSVIVPKVVSISKFGPSNSFKFIICFTFLSLEALNGYKPK